MTFALLSETFDADPLLASSDFVAEEKLDGMRLQLRKTGNVVTGWTRQGVEWTVPQAVRDLALSVPFSFHADGELIGDRFVAFDVLALGDDATAQWPLAARRNALEALPLETVRQAITEDDKRLLLATVRAEGGEGIVFKRTGPYEATREYGVKFKFYRTETFKASGIDYAKGTCELLRAGRSFGRVRFARDGWPKEGQLCEVRFDSISESGKLMRPLWLGVRVDLDESAVA